VPLPKVCAVPIGGRSELRPPDQGGRGPGDPARRYRSRNLPLL